VGVLIEGFVTEEILDSTRLSVPEAKSEWALPDTPSKTGAECSWTTRLWSYTHALWPIARNAPLFLCSLSHGITCPTWIASVTVRIQSFNMDTLYEYRIIILQLSLASKEELI